MVPFNMCKLIDRSRKHHLFTFCNLFDTATSLGEIASFENNVKHFNIGSKSDKKGLRLIPSQSIL